MHVDFENPKASIRFLLKASRRQLSLFMCHLIHLGFSACSAECVPLAGVSKGWQAVLLSLFSPPFMFFHFFLSDPPELEAPLCACGLFTTNTDSPSEVWRARTGREKYE